jgi:hypothetical protein
MFCSGFAGENDGIRRAGLNAYDVTDGCRGPLKPYLTAVWPGHVLRGPERRFFFSATEKIDRSVKMITARTDWRAMWC